MAWLILALNALVLAIIAVVAIRQKPDDALTIMRRNHLQSEIEMVRAELAFNRYMADRFQVWDLEAEQYRDGAVELARELERMEAEAECWSISG